MYKITIASGFLWITYCFLFLTFIVSIRSSSGPVETFKNVSMLFILLGFVLGFLLVFSGIGQKRRKIKSRIERTFVSQMMINNFTVLVFQIASKSGAKPEFVLKFFRTRNKTRKNYLNITENGIVSINNPYVGSSRKNR